MVEYMVIAVIFCGLAGLFIGFGVMSGVYLAQWVWKKLANPQNSRCMFGNAAYAVIACSQPSIFTSMTG
jgi:hypothetical protein